MSAQVGNRNWRAQKHFIHLRIFFHQL